MLYLVLMMIAGALAVLFFFGDAIPIVNLTGDEFARLAFLAVIGTVLAASVLGSRQRAGSMVRQMLVWGLIVLTLVGVYEYRFELQGVAGRITAGLIPGLPVTSESLDGQTSVTISRSGHHFATNAAVNGNDLRFIVDTGASTVVLTHEAARRAGLDTEALRYSVPVMTANGSTLAAPIRIATLSIGGIERHNVPALVAQQGQLFENLLGMSFLNSLSAFEFTGDRLILRD